MRAIFVFSQDDMERGLAVATLWTLIAAAGALTIRAWTTRVRVIGTGQRLFIVPSTSLLAVSVYAGLLELFNPLTASETLFACFAVEGVMVGCYLADEQAKCLVFEQGVYHSWRRVERRVLHAIREVPGMTWFMAGLVGMGLLLVWLELSVLTVSVGGCLGVMAITYGVLQARGTFRE